MYKILDLKRVFSSFQETVWSLLNWTPLEIRRQKHRPIFIFKYYNGLIDSDFKLTRNNSIHNHYTRTNSDLHLLKANTN